MYISYDIVISKVFDLKLAIRLDRTSISAIRFVYHKLAYSLHIYINVRSLIYSSRLFGEVLEPSGLHYKPVAANGESKSE